LYEAIVERVFDYAQAPHSPRSWSGTGQ
jgi:hypothetical protein